VSASPPSWPTPGRQKLGPGHVARPRHRRAIRSPLQDDDVFDRTRILAQRMVDDRLEVDVLALPVGHVGGENES